LKRTATRSTGEERKGGPKLGAESTEHFGKKHEEQKRYVGKKRLLGKKEGNGFAPDQKNPQTAKKTKHMNNVQDQGGK